METPEYNGTLTTEYDCYYCNYSYGGEPVELEESMLGHILGIFSSVCYCLIFCLSLAGNSFLLWTTLRRENLRRTSSLLLLHLTLSDLIFTIPLPLWAMNVTDGWVLGEVSCRLLSGVLFLGFYSYMAFLTAMAVQRYRAVVHAVKASSFKCCPDVLLNVHLLSAGLWVLCLAFSIPEMVFSTTVEVENGSLYCNQTHDTHMPIYLVYYLQIAIFFLLPFTVITFCYSRMWFRIRNCRMSKKNKATRLIFLIVVGFFICWTPYNIFLLINALGLHELISNEHSEAFYITYSVSHTLAYAHCCLSPVIHILGAGKFRERLSGSFRRLSFRERSQTFSTHTHENVHSASAQTYF